MFHEKGREAVRNGSQAKNEKSDFLRIERFWAIENKIEHFFGSFNSAILESYLYLLKKALGIISHVELGYPVKTHNTSYRS